MFDRPKEFAAKKIALNAVVSSPHGSSLKMSAMPIAKAGFQLGITG